MKTPTILVSQTYEIVTPESAEHGDAEERGFKFENAEYTFRELIDLMEEHPEPSDYCCGPYTWFTYNPSDPTDFTTGEYESTSIHFSQENPERLRKYWIKAAQIAHRSRR